MRSCLVWAPWVPQLLILMVEDQRSRTDARSDVTHRLRHQLIIDGGKRSCVFHPNYFHFQYVSQIPSLDGPVHEKVVLP